MSHISGLSQKEDYWLDLRVPDCMLEDVLLRKISWGSAHGRRHCFKVRHCCEAWQ